MEEERTEKQRKVDHMYRVEFPEAKPHIITSLILKNY